MNSFQLATYLTSNTGIDESIITGIVSKQKKKQVHKNDFLLMQGEICKYSFFVEKGLLRYYSIDAKGKEHILQFAPEGWFVSDRESLYFNQPSQYFIQAMEDSVVVVLDKNFAEDISNADTAFAGFNYRLLHNHIRHLQNRVNMLLGATAEERYLDFVKIYPDILLRVPQSMVASYLGITPESLSRVRKDLSKKNTRS